MRALHCHRELTSPQLLRQINGQVLLVVPWERQIVHHVVAPDGDHVDAQALVLVVPDAEVVALELVLLKVLEEGVVLLGGNRPIIPSWAILLRQKVSIPAFGNIMGRGACFAIGYSSDMCHAFQKRGDRCSENYLPSKLS